MTNPKTCPHARQTFRKAPGCSRALLVCLDCGHQQTMSMDQALKRIIQDENQNHEQQQLQLD